MGKPEIRFKGYTDEWEQRKLGNIASSFEYGLNAAAKEYDGENKYIRITDVDDNTHEFLTDNLTSPDIDLTDADNYKLTGGDILFARTGASVGKSYIYRDSDGLVYYAGFLIRARIKEEYDAEFVFQNTLTDRYNKYIAVTSQRSGQPGVNAQEYAEFEINVPQKEEQTKIGTYFRNIDHLITLHQRKCDEVKSLKKYMLQKMFPQNEQKVQEIRFEGFTEAWEQRKLGEVCSRVQGNDGRMDLPTLTISAANGWMNQEDRFSGNIAGKEQKNYTLLHKGELSYNHGNSKLAKYGTVFSLQSYKEALVPRVYHSFKVEEGSPDFLEYYFATKLPDRELGKLISSGARMDGLLNIGYNEFMGIQMLFPSVEEQKQISNYFRNLDLLITLHQQKCEELKKIKKFMLQKMFV